MGAPASPATATDVDRVAGARPLSIELHGASRRYRTPAGVVTALETIDLAIAEGEFVVVLGPSGSGKTTLLNLIGALDEATDGEVRIHGRSVAGRSTRERFRLRRETLSFIFQSFNLFPGLTALENVQFGADVAGRADAREVARQALTGVGLAARESHFPHQLSGGEQQRVAIARALATQNPILLADEPTGELDYRTGVQTLLPDTVPEVSVHTTLRASSLALTAALGVAAVAAAPLFTIRRLRRMPIPDTLRVQE